MKKKIIIIISIVVALLVGLITYFIINDLNQEKILKDELTQISNIVNFENLDKEALDKKLNTIITKGDYAKVEGAYKAYLKDMINNIYQMVNILNDDKITSVLSSKNYLEDGKNFTNTKKYINNTIKVLSECKEKYYNYLDTDVAMSYINNKGLDEYYIDFYKTEIVKDIDDEKADKTIENSINDVISLLENSNKVIDFLIENKDNWEVQEDNILFTNDTLIEQYNKLINNL